MPKIETEKAVGFTPKEATELARYIHYPQCWDIAAYPKLGDAIYEIVSNAGCSEHPVPKIQNFGPVRIG